MKPVDITSYVLNRLWSIRDLPSDDFKGRAEELLFLYAENRTKAAELKDCNQYHCGHASCNAWRRAVGE